MNVEGIRAKSVETSLERCIGKAQMDHGHNGHFKLERWKNRSKQGSKVEDRHSAQRETLGKTAGGQIGANAWQEQRHIHAGQHRKDPRAPRRALSAILDLGPPASRPGRSLMSCHSFEATASCGGEWLSRRTLHHGVTSVTVPYDQRNLTHWAAMYPSEDLRECSQNSRRWPLLWRPWSQHSAQASSDRLSQFTEESLPPHPRTGKYI